MILVTGGAGFIGSHLVDALLQRGEQIVCFDDFNDFYDPEIKRSNILTHLTAPAYRLETGDICDRAALEELFQKYNIRKIVHLAARAGVRPSLQQPNLYTDVNINGTIHLLELARKYAVDQFVFASSSSVYGANTKTPFAEDDAIARTVSPYAATKYAGELLCYTYSHLYGIPISCLRFFTVYGPRQRPEMAIHKFTRLIYEESLVPFYGDGASARDYTYIDDIIQGVLGTLDFPQPFEVFNLGESTTVTLKQLVHLLEVTSGRKARLQMLPEQPGDVGITYADISKSQKMLGYRPTTPIEVGLRKFIDWYESERALKPNVASM